MGGGILSAEFEEQLYIGASLGGFCNALLGIQCFPFGLICVGIWYGVVDYDIEHRPGMMVELGVSAISDMLDMITMLRAMASRARGCRTQSKVAEQYSTRYVYVCPEGT